MKTISFKTSRQDALIIGKIAARAVKMAKQFGSTNYSHITANMDITACHANGNPLDLAGLLIADDFDFSHDVFGIYSHINRETGELMNCFVPRFTICSPKG